MFALFSINRYWYIQIYRQNNYILMFVLPFYFNLVKYLYKLY